MGTASGSGRGRTYDRHSGTGRPINEEKRGGQGKANWGSFQDEIDMGVAEIDEEAATQGAVSEANPEEAESKVRTLTLDEYQKQQAEKEAKLELNTNQRKVELDDSFKSEFKLLEKNLEEFGTVQESKKNKKKKNTKTKKTVEVGFTVGSSSPSNRGAGRGRGGRGGRGDRGERGERGDRGDREDRPRRGGRGGRGGRGDRGQGRRNDRKQGKPALSEDAFPSLS